MSRELPANPHLDHLKKQAKDLLRAVERGDPAAVAGITSRAGARAKLADAQHALASEYGFANWAALKVHVESMARDRKPGELLTAAIRASDADRTAALLVKHAELRARLNEPLVDYGAGMHALLAAVQRSDRRTIEVLLQAGADINVRSRHWAGGVGVLDECAPDFAPFLIERGAVLEAHAAARCGRLDALHTLVARDPLVVRARGANGQTPLHYASTVEIAEYLLSAGADIDAPDTLHESAPAAHMLRVVQARHYPRDRQDVARYLVSHGCQTDILMTAALGDLDRVRRHLDEDPASIRVRVSEAYFPKGDPRSEGTIYVQVLGRERTPHLVARDFGHVDVFRLLMDRSPEDVRLGQACELGDEATFRALLAARPRLIETLSDGDRRHLPDAAQSNNTNAVRLMLEAGWPIDATGEYGLNALQWASWHGNAEMVREILRHRPSIDLKDHTHGQTALGSALHGSENGWHRDTGDYATTVELLIAAGAKAPRLTDDLEASKAVRDVLRRHEAPRTRRSV